MTEAVTQEDRQSRVMDTSVQGCRLYSREERCIRQKPDGDRNEVGKLLNPHWQEKLLGSEKVPVPQTDTGRRGENPKTNGRTLVKELGKMTP